jgi:hypothetical protein
VLSAGSRQQAGWLAALERLTGLSTNVAHCVIPTATHESVLLGADATASAQAILDVVAAAQSGRPVR